MTLPTEQSLRDLVAERAGAVARKDAARLAGRQAPDILQFGVLPPFAERGAPAAERQTRAWFDLYPGPIGYEVSELEVAVDGRLGVCSFLYHVTGTLGSGDAVDMWVRATLACRWDDDEGGWRVFHDHESVPFDAASGQAVLTLE